MKRSQHRYGFLMLLILLYSATAFSGGNNISEDLQIKIFLPQSSVINSEKYRLGEIAQIEGEDHLLLDNLEKIVIGRSPLPGR